ncbi:MAG TPA: zinc-binding dehydrogenase [Pseudonocardiaceae bacterium]|nr:zinc-binding dehydrogenase [Pseudonocardiaceae bacterium]
MGGRLLGESGALSIRVSRTFPLEHAADAHRLLADAHLPGRLVLVPCSARRRDPEAGRFP